MELNLQKNQICRLTIAGYGSNGEGVSHLPDGRAIFIKGALRGEVCDVQILKLNKSMAWGRVHKVVAPSPARVLEKDCPHYPVCGGCQMRHMSYEEECAAKRQRVEDALVRIGGVPCTVDEILGGEQPLRYRNKIQFPVDQEGKIGFYRGHSHDVIDVPDCLLQPEGVAPLRQGVVDWMGRYNVTAYDEKTGRGLLRHVFVRVNHRGQCLCALVVNGKKLPHEDELVSILRQAQPQLVGVVLNVNRRDTNVILGHEYRTLWGQDVLEEELCGHSFRLSTPSFYQVNRRQAEVLYRRALDYADLTGHETVLDLYCGIGTISLLLAQKAGQVIGAEVVPEAVADAKDNAQRNGVHNVEFLCGDAGDVAETLAQRGTAPQVICVDPPRKGLAPQVIEAICAMAPEKVVYVSCNPATLGRDIKLLTQGGYTLQKATAVDLFPRTHHVEAVVLLSRACVGGEEGQEMEQRTL